MFAIDPAGEIVLQGVHVRWVFGNLLEAREEENVDRNAEEMQSTHNATNQEGGLQHFTVLGGRMEEGGPTTFEARSHLPVVCREEGDKDIEGQESNVNEEGEGIVASR